MNLLKLAELYLNATNSKNWYAAELSRKCDQYLEGYLTFEELLHNVHELTEFIERKENVQAKEPPSSMRDISEMIYDGGYEDDEPAPETMRSKVAKRK